MIGKKLKETRKELGLTQKELGELLGISGNSIARYEREELQPQHPKVLDMALSYLRLTPKTRDNIARLALDKKTFAAQV